MKYDQRTKVWTHSKCEMAHTQRDNMIVHCLCSHSSLTKSYPGLAGICKVARLDSCIRVAWVLTKWLKIPILIDNMYVLFVYTIFHVFLISAVQPGHWWECQKEWVTSRGNDLFLQQTLLCVRLSHQVLKMGLLWWRHRERSECSNECVGVCFKWIEKNASNIS